MEATKNRLTITNNSNTNIRVINLANVAHYTIREYDSDEKGYPIDFVFINGSRLRFICEGEAPEDIHRRVRTYIDIGRELEVERVYEY